MGEGTLEGGAEDRASGSVQEKKALRAVGKADRSRPGEV